MKGTLQQKVREREQSKENLTLIVTALQTFISTLQQFSFISVDSLSS